MLTGSQIDSLPGEIIALYQDYEDSILRDIARRLAGLDFATPTAAWEMTRLTESGLVFENALRELAQLTGKSYVALRSMFAKAGVLAVRFDDKIYRAAGLNPLPLNLSPAAANALLAGLAKTGGVMTNMTLTTAIDGQRAFVDAANTAYMQVTNGAMSYTQAIRAAVKNVAAEGISTIDFASGRRDQLDVAMRRTVLTGVAQTTSQVQMARADEMGTDLVAVSAHAGARNKGEGPMNHEGWQGKVYSRSGTNPKYENFYEITGYGTGEGLGGWNCRHSFYPFFEGLSEAAYNQAQLDEYADKTVTLPDGREVSQYEASQVQRGIERHIRDWKRQADALSAAGLDNTAEIGRVRAYQEQMRDFVKATNLSRQGAREGGRVLVNRVAPIEAVENNPQMSLWNSGQGNLDISKRFVEARDSVPIEKQVFLSHNTAEEIAISGSNVFVSLNGNNGFIIAPDGDIQNLFSTDHSGIQNVLEAINQGGRKLDCFDGMLPKFYERFGFVEVRRVPNWTPGGPDVVYMELRPK